MTAAPTPPPHDPTTPPVGTVPLLHLPRAAGGGAATVVGVFLALQAAGGWLLQRQMEPSTHAASGPALLIWGGWTLLGAAALGAVGIAASRRRRRHLADLTRAAHRLEAGDDDTPVPLPSAAAETRGLAQALEAMRHSLRHRDNQVHRLAYIDPLTLLPNRARFAALLEERLHRGSAPFAVLLLDLDRFKLVNDVLGRHVGDRLLQGVAWRLHGVCPPERGTVARLSGDEFAILLHEGRADDGLGLAAEILADFERPLTMDEETIDLSAGIGIVVSPDHGREVNPLLSRLELATYAAKQRQCGSLVYHPAMDPGTLGSLSLLSEMRRALERGELRLFLQPKVDLQSGRIIGAEALLRWQHPRRGLIPPMEFVPFAEQTGFIRRLSAWVLAQAGLLAREALDAGLRLRLSVNLSTRDLVDQDLPAKVESIVRSLEIPPDLLCLEITESAIMDDPERALHTLEQLHALGLKLSIDDFGTGYSSLAYLKRLPVDELKIDRTFVMAMERDVDDARIVRSTIELAHNLGVSVVAEGLETLTAWKMLAELGCDEGQGYVIGRPMPQREFLAWVQGWEAPDLRALPGLAGLRHP